MDMESLEIGAEKYLELVRFWFLELALVGL